MSLFESVTSTASRRRSPSTTAIPSRSRKASLVSRRRSTSRRRLSASSACRAKGTSASTSLWVYTDARGAGRPRPTRRDAPPRRAPALAVGADWMFRVVRAERPTIASSRLGERLADRPRDALVARRVAMRCGRPTRNAATMVVRKRERDQASPVVAPRLPQRIARRRRTAERQPLESLVPFARRRRRRSASGATSTFFATRARLSRSRRNGCGGW